jgi:DNA-binding transcriptional LysR family regulator
MDRLTSLTAFVRVVDNGGFSAAGRRLNMSTTMVSSHVQALEDRLGVRLLNRTTRKVSLTEVGKAYYDRAIQILADLEQADDIASTLQSTPRGTLRIYVSTHMVPFVAPVVTEFMSAYPEVKLEVMMGERDIDMIEEEVDVAVRLTPPKDSSLITRSLATWRHVLCCSHGYIEKHGRPQQLADLAAHNCLRHIHYPYPDEWRFVDHTGAPVIARISGTLVTNSGETLRQAALHGVGVSLAAGFLVGGDLEAGRLVRLLPDYRPIDFAVNATYPHRHHLSVKVRIFIDLLAKHSADQQKLINPYD